MHKQSNTRNLERFNGVHKKKITFSVIALSAITLTKENKCFTNMCLLLEGHTCSLYLMYRIVTCYMKGNNLEAPYSVVLPIFLFSNTLSHVFHLG